MSAYAHARTLRRKRQRARSLAHSSLLWRWPTCPLSPTPPPLVGLRAGRIVLTHTLAPFFFLPAASLAVTSCASGKHFVCCSDWPCVTHCGLTQGAQSGGMPLIKQKSAAAAAQLSFFLWLKLCRHKTITKATTLVTIVVLMMISDLDYLSVATISRLLRCNCGIISHIAVNVIFGQCSA